MNVREIPEKPDEYPEINPDKIPAKPREYEPEPLHRPEPEPLPKKIA